MQSGLHYRALLITNAMQFAGHLFCL